MSKNIARVFAYPDGTRKSTKFKAYVPHGDTLKYTILKKIYFKAFDIMSKRPLSLADFKAIAIIIIEKECRLNDDKIRKNEGYYAKIKLKVIKEIEKHFKLLEPLDVIDSIKRNKRIKVDLKELLKEEVSNIKNTPIDAYLIDEISECKFIFDCINIQREGEFFNIVLTLPYDVNKEFVHRNCIIGTIIKYAVRMLSKELELDFAKLIVYYPLKLSREEYQLKDVLYTFQTGQWLKVLNSIKHKSTTTCIDNKHCKYCENNIWCLYGGLDYKKSKYTEERVEEMI